MAIKVFIKRKIKDGQLQEASRLISKTRYGAMGQKGYISSETLTGHSDQNPQAPTAHEPCKTHRSTRRRRPEGMV